MAIDIPVLGGRELAAHSWRFSSSCEGHGLADSYIEFRRETAPGDKSAR